MMKKRIATLRDAPPESVEVPEVSNGRQLQRSCFGAIRLFPGVPKTMTEDELEYVAATYPAVRARLHVQPYVESRRVDRRGVGEAQVEKLAAAEGLGHLPHARQLQVLRERGLIPSKK